MILHTDFLYKFTHEGVRIYIVLLRDAVAQSAQIHALRGKDIEALGYTHAVACCLAAMRKEDNASVCAVVREPKRGKKYTAIAEPDGRLRGRADELEVGAIKEGVILEVTQKLSIRGDYTSVVTGPDIGSAVEEYFRISQQTIARCAVRAVDDTYMCVLVEQFPITQPEHEIYRGAAEREWQVLQPLLQAQKLTDFSVLEQYERTAMLPLKFGCTCTRRSLTSALQALTPEEKKSMADSNGQLHVQCKYCGKEYHIKI